MQDQQSGGTRWLCFRKPVEVIQADSPDEVPCCLDLIDERANAGFHVAGFISYEAAPGFDRALVTHPASVVPCLWFGVFDRHDEVPLRAIGGEKRFSFGEWTPSISRDRYDGAINTIKHHIREGDTYQVNYTFRLNSKFEGDPAQLFSWLHQGQQSRYSAYIDLGRYKICSVSPELFVSLNGETIVSRPMKGTLPRGYTDEQDRRDSDCLRSSDKNRAENVMIVDMIRNDIGRIAVNGTVGVPKLFEVEKYPTVQQMTSTVTASTSASTSEILRAMFPCASITGAPKVKTMQIIKALEPGPRGVYTGSIGYIAPGRQMQFNVAIRTMLLDIKTATAEYGVGGGITWYSEASSEYQECCAKALVLNQAYPEFELLESLAWDEKHGYYLLDGHLRRLEDSGRYFGFRLSIPAIKTRLATEQSGFEGPRRKIRLLVDRNGEVTIESEPINSMTGSRVSISRLPINTHTPFVFHKTTNRAVYADALSTKGDGVDDFIFWNENGFVTESSMANVVIDDGSNRLITPPAACGLLAGVQRSHLLKQEIIYEKMITIDDLKNAKSVYLINSVRGWLQLQKENSNSWVVVSEQFPRLSAGRVSIPSVT